MGDLNLQDITRPLLKWWWLLAASALIATAFTAYNAEGQPPRYRSLTTLMVGTALLDPNPSGNEFSLAGQLAAAYADIARRSTVYEATRQALGLARLPDYSVRQVPQTQIIEIIVEDVDPARAQAVAAELVNQLVLQTPSEQTEGERQSFVEQQLDQMEANILATDQEIERLNQQLGTLFSARQIADVNTQIDALNSKKTALQNNYAALLASSRRGATNTINVLEPPNFPAEPIDSNLKVFLLAAGLLGLVLAASGAYLIEYLDDFLRTEQDASKYLGLETLGIIPSAGKRTTSDDRLLFNAETHTPLVDAYSGLRISLGLSMRDKPLWNLLVTCAGATEDKSVVTANLCVELARAGYSVILVDADLYRPSQQRIFKLMNDIGLTTFLHDEEMHIGNLLQQTSQPGLAVLTSGPLHPNPAQLLGTKQITVLLDHLQDMADIVVVDAPPATVAVDASILATHADGVLMVLTAGRTKRGLANRAVNILRQVHANVLGVVLDDAPLKQSIFRSSDGYGVVGVHVGKSHRAKGEPSSGAKGFYPAKRTHRLTTVQTKESTSPPENGHN
jgi:capsular exopolysaccharide synthesis family protein